MTMFFTADTHFGHDRIREMCNRPYASLEAMNDDMISRWNAVVKPADEVWHLGDVFFYDVKLFDRLNGRKHLIIGNHDRRKTLKLSWSSTPRDYHELKPLNADGTKLRVVLLHYPMERWNSLHHGSLHLHGHTHGTVPNRPQRCDVGVDCWNFTPVRLSQIMARLADL